MFSDSCIFHITSALTESPALSPPSHGKFQVNLVWTVFSMYFEVTVDWVSLKQSKVMIWKANLLMSTLQHDEVLHWTEYESHELHADSAFISLYVCVFILSFCIWVILLKTGQNCDIEDKNSKCELFNAIIWKWKLDISCVHKYKT